MAHIRLSARLYGLFLVDTWHCDGWDVAHFWQTEAEHPSAIIPCGMWAGCTCQVWARYGPEKCRYLARIRLSTCLYGLFLADIWHCDGWDVAHFWQTEAEHPSAIIPCGMWAGCTCQVWARYGPEKCRYLARIRLSTCLYGLFLADIWHCDGLVVAHF